MSVQAAAVTQNHSPKISEIIGEFAAGFDAGRIPDAVIEHAKYLLLDAIGIAFASSGFDFADSAGRAFQPVSGNAGATVIGLRGARDMRDALVLNGMLVHGLDFDDTYFAGGIHPTASCFPSALAVAEECDATGRDLLAGYIVGMEVTTRLGGVAQGLLNQAGFHPTSLIGAFAGAVVAGYMHGLTAHQIAMAQGLALGMAGGTIQSLEDGSWTKRIQPGWAAAAGITAAKLAQHGFVGSAAAYEGRFGLFPAHLAARAGDADYAAATRALGEKWEVERVALKAFPACHATQSVIEAAITVSTESGLRPDEVDSMTAIVPPQYVTLVCEPMERKRKPDSVYGAQFSIPYTVACSFIRRRFGLDDLKEASLHDGEILSLAQRVGYQVDSQFTIEQFKSSRPAELVVKAKDGRSFSRKIEKPMGAPDRPMSNDDIRGKFFDNVCSRAPRDRAQAIFDHVMDLDRCPSARQFAAGLAG